MDKSREEECAGRFAGAISDRLALLSKLADPVRLWDHFKLETLDRPLESAGDRPKERQNLIPQEALEVTDLLILCWVMWMLSFLL